jgi:membrane protein YdbS with pleckstrin-like domain
MASFCPRCGKSTGPDDRYCKGCGADLAAGSSSGIRPTGSGATPVATPSPSEVTSELTPIPTPSDLPFHLQEGEVLYREIRPGKKLFWRFTLGGVIGAVVMFVFAAVLYALFLAVAPGTSGFLLSLFLVVLGALILVASIVTGWLSYTKFRFWITSQRTVGRRGVVSYSIDSIPLETISDVIVSRSITDRLLGLSSLYIQPFGGPGFYPPQSGAAGSQYQSSNTFPGLDAPEAVVIQQQILHLRTVRRASTTPIL